jgi:hypothetical protein
MYNYTLKALRSPAVRKPVSINSALFVRKIQNPLFYILLCASWGTTVP